MMDKYGQRRFSAVILTGGTGQRLGGVDKALLVVGGRTLLESALDAVQEAQRIVIVGPEIDLPRTGTPPAPIIIFTNEDPPSGGPAAGLLAGRDALPVDVGLIVVLAVDMPGVTRETIRRLIDARGEAAGAFLHDASGRRQLAGVLAAHRLDEIRPAQEQVPGLPLHRLLSPLHLTEVKGERSESRDVDTPDDLAQ